MGPRDKRLKDSRGQESIERGGEVLGAVGNSSEWRVEKTWLGKFLMVWPSC